MSADPWTLLREAREALASDKGYTLEVQALFGRIDKALAIHAEPVEVVWKAAEYGNQYASIYDSANTTLRIAPRSGVKGKWAWDATVYGYADTEAEAKEKALKAATKPMPRLTLEVTRLKAEVARAETDRKWAGVGETGPVLFK